jgi:hypothetical protein
MVSVTQLPEPPYRMAREVKLNGGRTCVFRATQDNSEVDWKFEKCAKHKDSVSCEFATDSATRLAIACIRHKSEADATVRDVHKQRAGRHCTVTSPASSVMVLEQYTSSAQNSAKQCALWE